MGRRITLEERPNRMTMAESNMRYAVMLDGVEFSELYYNMRGYRGAIPCKGHGDTMSSMDIGEKSISSWRKEIALSNRELS